MKFEKCKTCKFRSYEETTKPCIKCTENNTPLSCTECRYQKFYMYERGYNCVGNGVFIACEEFQWD